MSLPSPARPTSTALTALQTPASLPLSTPETLVTQAATASPLASERSAPDTACAAPAPVLIADRGEFIDALRRLRRGHVLVRPRAAAETEHANCVLDSGVVYTAFQPLRSFGLIHEYPNPDGFATMRYYCLTSSGKRFADKALRSWRQRPLLERLAVRLLG